jgi:hypothetical protein
MKSWTMATYQGIRSGIILNQGVWMAFIGDVMLPLRGRHEHSVDAIAELQLELVERYAPQPKKGKSYRRLHLP